MADLFMSSEPSLGWRAAEVRDRRIAVDFAEMVRWLVEETYDSERSYPGSHLVLANASRGLDDGVPLGEWSLDLRRLSKTSCEDGVPMCELGEHYAMSTISWDTHAIRPVYGGDLCGCGQGLRRGGRPAGR